MPTARVSCSTVAQALWSQTRHKKGKISAVNIDNGAAAPQTIRIQDIFTPDVSAGVAIPVAQTKERLQVTVPAGQSASYDEQSLKDIEMLGDAKAIGGTIAAACIIICNYTLE